MPGVFQLSVDEAIRETDAARHDGVPGVLLFGLPASKDEIGSGAYDADAPVQSAVRAIKRASPDTVVVTDVCLCEYTSHGHCGVLDGDRVANDDSLRRLADAAITYARAGADVVAPSAMMDGQVAAIRDALEADSEEEAAILAYAAKHASALYGPFRDAADSAPAFGDRRSYQMDPANGREALRELSLDAVEGADILMVKPALTYLDVIARARAEIDIPIAAYHVSGEYALVRAAAERGWIDALAVATEQITAVKRAGADLILTYFARDLAESL